VSPGCVATGPTLARMVSVIAKNLQRARQYNELCAIFEKADNDGGGTISLQEYTDCCEEFGVDVTEDDIELFKKLAGDDGEVHKNDFIRHLKSSGVFGSTSNIDPDSELHWIKKVDMAFKLFDKNKDGLISRKEFGWMIHSDKVNKKQIENMFRRCDLNGDGKLDYNEFKTMIFKNKERKQQEAEKNELEGKTSPKKKKQEKGKGKKKKK